MTLPAKTLKRQPPQEARRALLKWLGGATLLPAATRAAPDAGRGHVRIEDSVLSLQFDAQMRCRLTDRRRGAARALTRFDDSETLLGANGQPLTRFTLTEAHADTVVDPEHGPAQRLTLRGRSAASGIEKTVTVRLPKAHPGFALVDVAFQNTGARALAVQGWATLAHRLQAAPARIGQAAGQWLYSGASHGDRRDWMQPVKRGFDQRNFMGMNASDYGGGTPVVDLWRRDGGLAIGHVDTVPRLVAFPVRAVGDTVTLAMRSDEPIELAPGATLATPTGFAMLHAGDCFTPLDAYRRVMAERGLAAPQPPATSYEPIWCAWGYEREFSVPLVAGTLTKVKELGLQWAVLDDGWQQMTGDWRPDPAKFTGGEAGMKAFVDTIHAQGLKARLWIAPLAVAPGSDELRDHTDMLLLDKDGAAQAVSWWNCFYLCPAYEKTQQRTRAFIQRVIGAWGFDGLKIDGQHLNGVAPCHNPAHHHAKPEASVEGLAGFFKVIYDTAREIKPDAVVELCPCGTAYAFHTMPWMNQAPASDPLTSWQVRLKGKALRALMGPHAAYAGDHVELSDGGNDFASTVGIGAVVSTKFTWPVDPKPKDSFLLTPERERQWRHWIGLYKEQRLAEGRYRGELYDIAFDQPEAHVVEKDGVLHYAFYALRWDGPVPLRGLAPGRYRLRDYANGTELGTATVPGPVPKLRFEGHLLLEVVPVTA
ncbi:MAG TPA: glycoside hydrolase family 36 protein [Ideonella sp.]|nr:glycoside hydrolase family 36 protein [Ideonella sp.]